jgi:hypothetical protein
MEFAERQLAEVAVRDGWKVLGRYTTPTGIAMVRVAYPAGYHHGESGRWNPGYENFRAEYYDNARVTKADETWRNPADFGTNSLHYRAAWGKHVITHSMNAGEDANPNVYRYDTKDEARAMWARLRTHIKAAGYTELVK